MRIAITLVLLTLAVLSAPAPAAAQGTIDFDQYEHCLVILSGSFPDDICLHLEVRYTVPGQATLGFHWPKLDYERAVERWVNTDILGNVTDDYYVWGYTYTHPDPDSETYEDRRYVTYERNAAGAGVGTIVGLLREAWHNPFPPPRRVLEYLKLAPILRKRDGTRFDDELRISILTFTVYFPFRAKDAVGVVGLPRTPGACDGFSNAPCFTAPPGGNVWRGIETAAAAVALREGSDYSSIANRLIDTVCEAAPMDFPSVCRARPDVGLFFRSEDPVVIDFTHYDGGFWWPDVTGRGGTTTLYVDAVERAGVGGTIRADNVSVPPPLQVALKYTLSSTAASVPEGGSVGLTATANAPVPADTVVTLVRDGSSTAGLDDYAIEPETITITAGQLSGTATLTAMDDEQPEGEESLTLTGWVGDVAAGTVTIIVTDNDRTDGERAALVALYNASGGSSWVNNTNWLSGRPIALWYGVATDGEGRVTHLRLQNNGLTGVIPRELASLEVVTHLWFNDNDLAGSIPGELGELAHLGHFSVDTNRRLTGSVPPSFGNLRSLWTLRLEETALSGALPQDLTNLRNLRHLSMHDSVLCVPDNEAFRIWVESLSFFSGRYCGAVPAMPPVALLLLGVLVVSAGVRRLVARSFKW